jgi:hypothetical protein
MSKKAESPKDRLAGQIEALTAQQAALDAEHAQLEADHADRLKAEMLAGTPYTVADQAKTRARLSEIDLVKADNIVRIAALGDAVAAEERAEARTTITAGMARLANQSQRGKQAVAAILTACSELEKKIEQVGTLYAEHNATEDQVARAAVRIGALEKPEDISSLPGFDATRWSPYPFMDRWDFGTRDADFTKWLDLGGSFLDPESEKRAKAYAEHQALIQLHMRKEQVQKKAAHIAQLRLEGFCAPPLTDEETALLETELAPLSGGPAAIPTEDRPTMRWHGHEDAFATY